VAALQFSASTSSSITAAIGHIALALLTQTRPSRSVLMIAPTPAVVGSYIKLLLGHDYTYNDAIN
jgi:hypothetical protein